MFTAHFGAGAVPALTSPAPSGSHRDLSGQLLVAEVDRRVVGFAHVVDVDEQARLEQLSVHPTHGRRGIGTALVRAALVEADWLGYRLMTLCTYRDVPWNGPFYSRLGFEELAETGYELARLRRREQDLRLDECGVRIAMRRAVR